MRNKRGIELSINFLVIVILSIAVLGMGIVFVNKLFGAAEKKQAIMDQRIREQIKDILRDGRKVGVYPERADIRPKKTKTFGIGILNTDKNQREFKIKVEPGDAFDRNRGSLPKLPEANLIYDESTHLIGPKDDGEFALAVAVPKEITLGTPTKSGTYIINVDVCWSKSSHPYQDGGSLTREAYNDLVIPADCGCYNYIGDLMSGTFPDCSPPTSLNNKYGSTQKIYVHVP